MYSKVIQLYIYIYNYNIIIITHIYSLFTFSSITGYYKILSIVLCAIQ